MELSPFLFGLYKLTKYALYPMSWLSLLLVTLCALALLPFSPRRFRWIRWSAIFAVLILFGLGTPLASTLLMGVLEEQAPPFDSSTTKTFDAIVVLGGGVVGKGSLRPAHALVSSGVDRTLCAADLYAHGFAPRILFSGGDASIFGEGPKEGAEMKAFARRLGIPADAILTEDQSRTSYENAVETKRILGQASIVLVTTAIHVPRAVALFRKQGFDPTPYPCGYAVQDRLEDGLPVTPFDLLPQAEALRASTLAINEMAGFLVYRISGKL